MKNWEILSFETVALVQSQLVAAMLMRFRTVKKVTEYRLDCSIMAASIQWASQNERRRTEGWFYHSVRSLSEMFSNTARGMVAVLFISLESFRQRDFAENALFTNGNLVSEIVIMMFDEIFHTHDNFVDTASCLFQCDIFMDRLPLSLFFNFFSECTCMGTFSIVMQ